MLNIKSRRSFFRYMAVFGFAAFCASQLHAKTSKEIVKYQDMPKEGKKSKECLHFISETNECKTVAGVINPDGWCSIYFKHPNYKEKVIEDNNESNITA